MERKEEVGQLHREKLTLEEIDRKVHERLLKNERCILSKIFKCRKADEEGEEKVKEESEDNVNEKK